jgi:non-homologous end joining protein Ku
MQIKQFVKAEELSPAVFDRPYFVAPKEEVQAKALSIMRKALAQTDTLGIGRSLSVVANTWSRLALRLIQNRRV